MQKIRICKWAFLEEISRFQATQRKGKLYFQKGLD